MKTVAIVDDEHEILNVLEKFLTKTGKYKVQTYSDPVRALSTLTGSSHTDTDVVLLDIMMPQMDGIEFLEKLKKQKPEIEVIMITAYSTLDRVLKSHKYGAHQYITKPFGSMQEIDDKIEQVLSQS